MLSHASLYKCAPVGQATGLMKAPTWKLLNSMTSAWFSVFGLANRGSGQPRFQLVVFFCSCISMIVLMVAGGGCACADEISCLHEKRIKLWTNAISSRTPGRFYTWISYTSRHQRDGRLRSPLSSPGVPWIIFFFILFIVQLRPSMAAPMPRFKQWNLVHSTCFLCFWSVTKKPEPTHHGIGFNHNSASTFLRASATRFCCIDVSVTPHPPLNLIKCLKGYHCEYVTFQYDRSALRFSFSLKMVLKQILDHESQSVLA